MCATRGWAKRLLCVALLAAQLAGVIQLIDMNNEMNNIAPSPNQQIPDQPELEALADLFKVFGDATRIHILFILCERGEANVTELTEFLGVTQSAVSHQLQLLKQNKLVTARRDGKSVIYSLADEHVNSIIATGREHIEEDPV